MLRVNQLTGFWYSPSDLDFLGGAALILGESAGMGIDFTYHSDINKQVKIRGTGSYYGPAQAKLTYTSPSLKLCRQSDGVWRYGNHNLCPQSQTLATTWTAGGGATVTADTATAPDGTPTADQINESASVNLHYITQTFSIGTGFVVIKASIFAKVGTGTRQRIAIELRESSGNDGGTGFFNVLNGTADAAVNNGAGTNSTVAIENVGNGWWKCTFTTQPNPTLATTAVRLVVALADNSTNTITITGTAGHNTLLWGVELKGVPVQVAAGLAGYLVTTSASVYDLPFEWDVNGNSLGILVEEQRQNLVFRSQEFGSWSLTDITLTANNTIAPDGTSSADKALETVNNNYHQVHNSFTGAAVAHTASIFVKDIGRRFIRVIVNEAADTTKWFAATFDLTNVVVSSTGAGSGGGTFTAASLVDAGNGWFRCIVTGTVGAGTILILLNTDSTGAAIAAANDRGRPATFVGDVTKGFYYWGAQVEAGAFATSPIYTVATSNTRAPDKLSLPTASFPYSSATSTVVEYLRRIESQGIVYLWELFNAAGDRTLVYTLGSIRMFNNAAGINDSDTVFGPISVANLDIKIGTAIAVNDLVSCIDAGTVTVDVGGNAMPAAATTLYFGSNPADVTNTLNGYIRQFTYLPRRVTNLELQTRTNDLGASVLLLGEDEAMSFDFTYPTIAKQLRIKDNTTPANMFNGAPRAKLTYTSPSIKLCRQSDGIYRYGNVNLITRSQEFDNASWTKGGTTISANATTAPDGTLTADKLVESGANERHYITQSTASLGTSYFTFTIFAKPAGRNYIGLRCDTDGGTGSLTKVFDLTNGTITDTNISNGAPILVEASATPAGNGWYRLSVTIISTSGSLQFIPHVSSTATPSYSGGIASYAGDGSSGVYIWGAQVKPYPANDALGFTAATGYLATTSAVTGYDLPYEWNAAGVAQGILIEEVRTNLLTQSRGFASWVTESVTVTSGNTAPDGTSTAEKLVENTANGRHGAQKSYTLAADTVTTSSIFVKPTGVGSTRYFIFTLHWTTNHWINAVYNLSGAGSVTQTGVGATSGTLVSTSITAEANGWYRCTITGKSVTQANPIAFPCFATSSTPSVDTNGLFVYTGDSTSGLYYWNVQAEAGSFATSPIHTIGGSVTRVSDNLQILDTAGFPSSDSVGTMVAYIYPFRVDGGGGIRDRYLAMTDNIASDTALIYETGGFFSEGANIQSVSNVLAANALGKIAAAWAVTDMAVCTNGGTVATGSANATAPTVDRLRIGNGNGSDVMRGYLRQVTYLKRRATNVELQQKTQP